MSPDTPAWQSIDPADHTVPDGVARALASAGSPTGLVVLLVASEVDRRWGSDASLAVARSLADGRSVLLADASLEDPVLHESANLVNGEGLSDVMLYGASMKRVAQPLDGGVFLVSAGTPVDDASEVLAHSKWETAIRGFQEAGALLLVHLSANTTGADVLLGRATGIVLVAESDSDVTSTVDSTSGRVLAVIGPESAGELEAADLALEVMEPEVESTPEPEPEMVADMDDEKEAEFDLEPTSESEVEPNSRPDVESPELAELDQGGLFSMDALPESVGNVADEVEESGDFSFDGTGGGQYGTDGGAEAGDEGETGSPANTVDAAADVEPIAMESADDVLEVEPAVGANPSPDGADLEMEPAPADSLELDESVGAEEPRVEGSEAEASVDAEDAAEEVGLPAVEGVTRSEVEMDVDAVAAAAESAHLDMDGFETGAGFDLEDAPEDGGDDLMAEEVPLRGESEEELDSSEDFGFGDGGLEVEASPFAEDDVPEVVETPSIEGAAGDDAFGDRDRDPSDESAPERAGDTASPGVEAGDDGSIAVDSAAEAMGLGAGTSEEEPADEIDNDVDEGPPTKMSGLEELERRRRRGARVRQLLVGGVTALIVGGGGVGAAYLGFVNIPGITPPDRVRSAVPAPIDIPGPTPVTPVITHVLIVDAWRTLETALSTVDALRDRLPEFLFIVTLVEVDGGDQYAMLAGPAFSAVEADALKEPLAEVLDRLDPATWTVQEAQYSFFFGEYADAASAEGRVQTLTTLSIPAHILQVDYADGTTGLRVYGGAFVDEFQAAGMGRLLRANDLSDVRLTQRRGRLPE